MDHELLHNEPEFNLRLNSKGKKDKEKTDPGDRKKWNFRKGSSSETGGNRSPSPTSGLINSSADVKSKKAVTPTMIFENKISDNDYIGDITEIQPQSPLAAKTPYVQQKHVSPKPVSFDLPQTTSNAKRLRQTSLPLSTSPPPIINRPQTVRISSEQVQRQTSAPVIVSPVQSSKVIYQQTQTTAAVESFSQTASFQKDRSDVHRSINASDIQSNNQWQSMQQPFALSNTPQDDLPGRPRTDIKKKPPAGETVEDGNNMMWQGNNPQELVHGQWTDFSLTSNEVFVPDDKSWAVAENAAANADDPEQVSDSDEPNSSRTSNSSDSGNEEETEESVWRINEEQRAYYLNQFRILQPAEKGVVTGPKARDFFLKSGLTTDVLSRIWNLADLDSDGALNFEEFCIAMHIVVAVRHGLEVPAVLPHYLLPEQYEERQVSAALPPPVEQNNKDQLPSPDSSQQWARFSPVPQNTISPEDEGKTLLQIVHQAQPVIQQAQQASSQGHHVNAQSHQAAPQSHQVAAQGHQIPPVVPEGHQVNVPTQHVSPQGHQIVQPRRCVERTMSDPSTPDESTPKENAVARKTSVGIPRVRGVPKQTNLLDTPHWAILPPPSKFNKEGPDEGSKGNLFVPIGTIIPDTEAASHTTSQQASHKIEKTERPSPRDSQSDDSSSSAAEETVGKKERPKSLTQENNSSASSGSLSKRSSHSSMGEGQESVDGLKRFSAPDPPPRKKTGHSRSSSLDLQKLFNNKGGSASVQDVSDVTADRDSSQASRNSQENFADFSKFENTLTTSHSTENAWRHRRSASLDSTHAIWVEPSQPASSQNTEVKESSTSRHEVPASLPRPVPKKKPASPPPPLRQKKDGQQDSGSDGMIEKEKKLSKEPIHFVVKPLTRLEQLHAKIRDLKTKNTRLSRVNNELQQELKQMMEKRIGLESSLEQLKPFAK